MTTENAEQIADWNGTLGQRWAELQREIEGIVLPFGDAALQRAAAQPGERVIDIGCGCGDTSIKLARSVGAAGRVLGVDVSQPMLAAARVFAGTELGNSAGSSAGQLEFREADASEADLPAGNDLLFSRFGVMFFARPVPALRHLRAALRPGGRSVFVCWRTPRDNFWAMTPLAAARAALGSSGNGTPPADPHAPGPFAFADEDRLRGLLTEAGFAGIDMQRFDAPVFLGATPRLAAVNAARIGPAARFVNDAGSENLPAITAAIEQALTPLAAADGQVRLNGSTWLVTAKNP